MKKEQNTKKQPYVQVKKRADGTEEVIITKSPQHTLGGKIVVVILAALLGGGSILALIFALAGAM